MSMGPTLRRISPETCLVAEIISHFSAIESFEWPRWGLVLPTQRLATMVMVGLSQKKRAFNPPRFFNLESLIDAACEGAGEHTIPALTTPLMPPLAQECLLAGLIAAQAPSFKFLRLGHEHEVLQLFNEITLWDRGQEGWAALKEAVSQNTFLSEGALDTLTLRCQELETLFLAYEKALDTSPSLPAAVRLAQRSRWLCEQLATHGLPLSKNLRGDLPGKLLFGGFTSLNPLLTRVLNQFVHSSLWGPVCMVMVSEPPPSPSSQNPLQKLLDGIGFISPGSRPLPEWSPPSPGTAETRPFRVLVAPDPMAEVRGVLAEAHQAIRDGLDPSAVAILVTDDQMYGKYLKLLMPGFSGPFNVALQTSLETTLLGRWLQSILDWLRFGAGPGDLTKALGYLTHPLVERASQSGTRDQLLSSMDHYSLSSEDSPQWCGFVEDHRASRIHAQWSPLIRTTARRFGPWLAGHHRKPFRLWAEEFRSLVAHDLPLDLSQLPENFFEFDKLHLDGPTKVMFQEDIGIRMASYQTIVDFLSTLESLPTLGPEAIADFPVSRQEFLTVVQRLFRGIKVHSTGDPLYGIQVLSLAEARYIPFDLVFILGATEGQFPRALPVDHVLDNTLKTKLGLPGWQLLEAIEDTTFYLLRSRIPRLVLSYPDQGGTAVRSRFIEMALVLGEATLERLGEPSLNTSVLDFDGKPAALTPPPKLSSREIGWITVGADDPLLKPPLSSLKTQSATSLANLFQCPYRFFLDRCGINPLSVSHDRRTLREGKALHRVLEVFFQDPPPGPGITPLPVSPPAEPWPEFFTNRFQLVADHVLSEEVKGSPLFLHMQLKGWSDLGTFLAGLSGWTQGAHDKAGSQGTLSKAWIYLRQSQQERAFKTVLSLKQIDQNQPGPVDQIELSGRIDSIFTTPWGQVILDYKRKGLPSKSQAVLGDAPQLLVYALASQSPGPSQTLVGYYSLLDGCWLGVSAGGACQEQAAQQNLISMSKSQARTQSLEDIVDQFTSRLTQTYGEILGDESSQTLHFRAQPWRCNECSYHGICRREELSDAYL